MLTKPIEMKDKRNIFKLLGVELKNVSKEKVLDKIIKNIESSRTFCHIVSVNPENLVIANSNRIFRKIVETAQIQIIDGVGVVIAGRMNNLKLEKITGVDLMNDLIELASRMRLRVLLIGGKDNLALKLADCYSVKYSKAKFIGIEGIKDIKKPSKKEEKGISSIVTAYKPHLVFVAFGSPHQEIWIERHKNIFKKTVVMGVGGSFDLLSGRIARAPKAVRKLGFEWFFRLLIEPWRWRRQLRLIKFSYLVLKEKWKNS